MSKRKMNAAGLVILAVLLLLHVTSVIDLGAMIWVVCAFIGVAALGVVTSSRQSKVEPE